jgi:hypothetical protein
MKLRTFDGEPVRGKMTTDSLVSPDGGPVLLVNDEPFSPEEAEFFLEAATEKEMQMLLEGGYDLAEWEDQDEGSGEDEEDEEIESDDD